MKALLGAGLLLLPLSVHANDGTVRVELNKLEMQDTTCSAYIVLRNETKSRFSKLTLDLVMFDTQEIISRRLAVEMAPLRAGKTSVRVFGIPDTACASLGGILVNDVLACVADGSARETCIDMLEASSRTSVALID